ncbi:flagellin, partial [Tissierellaceae bacterium HCP3S3_D8]
ISLIQTAEGALTETHAILNRMRELAVQASNDTNTLEDRAEIQKEINQLSTEITRISTDTEFNTMSLLDGTLDAKFHIGANKGQNMGLEIGNMSSQALKVDGKAYEAQDVDATNYKGLQIRSLDGKDITIKFEDLGDENADEVKETKAEFDGTDTITITLAQAKGDGDKAGDVTATNADVKAALEKVASKANIVVSTTKDFSKETTAKIPADDIELKDWKEDEEIKGIVVMSQAEADAAIKTIDDATAVVSSERSKLGAVQNRLEHTINNLTATAENLSAAESRIRDVDMAEEMMEFTKNNILSQAATSMLAQANQMPNSVLQLLQ